MTITADTIAETAAERRARAARECVDLLDLIPVPVISISPSYKPRILLGSEIDPDTWRDHGPGPMLGAVAAVTAVLGAPTAVTDVGDPQPADSWWSWEAQGITVRMMRSRA